jgi:hypothetical protein
MAITLVASTVATPGVAGGTSAAIDTTGANLLILSVSFYAGGTTTLSSVFDAKANTWLPLTLRNTATTGHRFYYAKNAIVGSGHTVHVSAGVGIYPVIAFHAYAGADPTAPFDVENGATATGGSSLATGWAGMNATSNPTVGAGLTQTVTQNPVAGTCVAGGGGYLIQPTIAAINPTWSWTGTDHVAEAVAAFKPVAAAGAAETAQPFLILPM